MTDQAIFSRGTDPNTFKRKIVGRIAPDYYRFIFGRYTSGTATPDYISLDKRAEHIRYSYFLTKHYEAKYQKLSNSMFADWKEGKLSGPDYTKWVTAYLNVWDKIDATR